MVRSRPVAEQRLLDVKVPRAVAVAEINVDREVKVELLENARDKDAKVLAWGGWGEKDVWGFGMVAVGAPTLGQDGCRLTI